MPTATSRSTLPQLFRRQARSRNSLRGDNPERMSFLVQRGLVTTYCIKPEYYCASTPQSCESRSFRAPAPALPPLLHGARLVAMDNGFPWHAFPKFNDGLPIECAKLHLTGTDDSMDRGDNAQSQSVRLKDDFPILPDGLFSRSRKMIERYHAIYRYDRVSDTLNRPHLGPFIERSEPLCKLFIKASIAEALKISANRCENGLA
jgi:hypothetical protein